MIQSVGACHIEIEEELPFALLGEIVVYGSIEVRSWEQVDAETFDRWVAQLKKAEPKGVVRDVENIYFSVGEGVNGIASRLPGGRVVVVWGYLGWFDLERRFFTASDRIYEARY